MEGRQTLDAGTTYKERDANNGCTSYSNASALSPEFGESEASLKNPENREQWGNRTEFLFAAIGSAIGVGNILRFPVLVYRHGGLAFLVPYLLSLFILGIPLLKLETGMGQLFQCGIIRGMAKVNMNLQLNHNDHL